MLHAKDKSPVRFERVCIREESERIEVVPAQYEWSEERILVKEASTELVEVPAQFDTDNLSIQTDPGLSAWIKADQSKCTAETSGPAPQDISQRIRRMGGLGQRVGEPIAGRQHRPRPPRRDAGGHRGKRVR